MNRPSPSMIATLVLALGALPTWASACGSPARTGTLQTVAPPNGAPQTGASQTGPQAQSSPGQPVAAAAPHEIEAAGEWSGDDWGNVVIATDGTGSYTDTFGTGPGRLRLQGGGDRRYAGTWGESSQRFGTLELLLSPDGRTITGTWTPDPRSSLGSPTGGSLVWTRRP